MRRWFMWIPVLMVASLLFWTLALSLGGTRLLQGLLFEISPIDPMTIVVTSAITFGAAAKAAAMVRRAAQIETAQGHRRSRAVPRLARHLRRSAISPWDARRLRASV